MFILRHCDTNIPGRQSKWTLNKINQNPVFYPKEWREVLVSRTAFQDILGIKNYTILNVMQKYKKHAIIPVERRGGN